MVWFLWITLIGTAGVLDKTKVDIEPFESQQACQDLATYIAPQLMELEHPSVITSIELTCEADL